MTNYTATAFTASNESSRFWGFEFNKHSIYP